MIPKMNSKDLNNIFLTAKNNLDDLKNDVNVIKNDILDKVNIIKYETENIETSINKITSLPEDSNFMFMPSSQLGNFNKFGTVVTSELAKEPTNIFNLKLSATGNIFFRKDIQVYITADPEVWPINLDYNNILKHDSIKDKSIVFNNFVPKNKDDKETIIYLKIIADKNNPLGATNFNMIEFEPYLSGSFDIISIVLNENKNKITFGGDTAPYLQRVSRSRITLKDEKENTKFELYDITFKIKLNFKSTDGTFPFGFKHIYFYDADFKDKSYIVCEINKDNYISIIHDDITIYTPYGKIDTTISEQGIEIYTSKTEAGLKGRVYPSDNTTRNEILVNTKTLYYMIPLSKNNIYTGLTTKIELR